ncbi:MAG: VgrG-related protein [Chloroflexi bacterium]|nr:VgrG-related protein [Chloroflexota bacterium]
MSNPYAIKLNLKLGGQDLPEVDKQDIVEIVVDTDLNQPNMFSLLFDDPELKWVDNTSLKLGAEIEISFDRAPVMKGEISSLEPAYTAQGHTTLLVRGYDKSHRLYRGTQTRAFLKVSDSDIVSKLAKEVGLSATVKATKPVRDYVLQYGQNNMQFLRMLAARNGYVVYSDGQKLFFQPPVALSTAQVELEHGKDLLDFRPRASGVDTAPDKVTYYGWDVKKKEAIVGQAGKTNTTTAIGLGDGANELKKAFGSNAHTASPVVVDMNDAQTRATAHASAAGAEFLQAEGTCVASANLVAGKVVKIKGVGTRFGGNYLATSVRHVLNAGNWLTSFGATGYAPGTLRALLAPETEPTALSGVAPAIVTNNNDPEKMARVKVKFPWMPGGNIESDWLRVVSLMAGADRGMLFIPEVNDEVLVAAEFGDWARAYVVGSVWNGKDAPPLQVSAYQKNGKVIQRVIKTTSGHTILLDDSDDAPKISIIDKTTRNKIVIDSKNNSMEIACDKDLKITAKGKIDIEAAQDVTIKGMNMKMEANSNFNVDAKANVGLKATANLSAEATAQLSLKGTAQASLEGTGGVKVTSPAIAQIQGSLVKIN